jgi:hypothetical protein
MGAAKEKNIATLGNGRFTCTVSCWSWLHRHVGPLAYSVAAELEKWQATAFGRLAMPFLYWAFCTSEADIARMIAHC